MIAIVYSGSRTAFWKISSQGKTVAECAIQGINPFFNDAKQIQGYLAKCNTLINLAEQIKRIYVFAAGAASADKQLELNYALGTFFKNSKITVRDDIYGASVAACHNDAGIVGILGSGSNCAYFDGKKLAFNNFGLGFILGDEGSANHLGKLLLKKYLEDKLPADLKNKLEQKYNLERPNILERIYKKPGAQQYLSSYLEFYIEHRDHKHIIQMIDQAFDNYFKLYILPTQEKHPQAPLHFVGTVAGTFQDRLRLVAEKNNCQIISVIKEPIYSLLNYYTN